MALLKKYRGGRVWFNASILRNPALTGPRHACAQQLAIRMVGRGNCLCPDSRFPLWPLPKAAMESMEEPHENTTIHTRPAMLWLHSNWSVFSNARGCPSEYERVVLANLQNVVVIAAQHSLTTDGFLTIPEVIHQHDQPQLGAIGFRDQLCAPQGCEPI